MVFIIMVFLFTHAYLELTHKSLETCLLPSQTAFLKITDLLLTSQVIPAASFDAAIPKL